MPGKAQTTGTALELDTDGSGGGGGGDATAANQVLEIAALNSILVEEATEAKQDSQIALETIIAASLASIDSKTLNPQPISAAALPLPTGASTEATLALIKAKTDNIDVALSTRTKPADQQHVIVDSGSITTGGLTDVQLRATPVPISATNLDVALSTRLSESDFDTKIGSLTETAPTTDTASSALNGRLQRIAQRLTSLIALLPATIGGPKTAAASLSTTLASDDPAVSVLGVTTGAAVITDANGTIQQYLRGLIKLAITAGGFLVTATIGAGSALIGKVAGQYIPGAVVTLTTTNWLSLTSGSGWQSVAITTGGAKEIQFNLTTFGAAGSTALCDFYLAEAFTSGNFSDAATGTEGTFTAANRKNSRFLGSIQMNGAASVTGVLKYTDVSGTLSEKVALIGINNSGGTISSTAGNTVFTYELGN